MRPTEPFGVKVGAALVSFNAEAVVYCQGISDAMRVRMPWITQECSGAGRITQSSRTELGFQSICSSQTGI